MVRFFFFVSLMTVSFCLAAQFKRNSYRIKIECFNGDMPRGFLIALNDSSIRMITFERRRQVDTVYSFRTIKQVSLRRKNAPGIGFVSGLGVGAGLGAFIGYIAYAPPDCDGGWCLDWGPGFSALGGAVLGGLTGSLVGTGIGSSYARFPINGDYGMYLGFREKILNGPRGTLEKKPNEVTIW